MKFLISRVKTKNICNQKISKYISAGNNEKIELSQNQIIYLKEECNSENQLINLLLKNFFKSDIPKVTYYTNSNTLLTPNDNYQFPKRFCKNHHQKSSYNSCTRNNKFQFLSVNEDSQYNNEDLHFTESSGETLHSDDNQNQNPTNGKTNRNRSVNRKQRRKRDFMGLNSERGKRVGYIRKEQ